MPFGSGRRKPQSAVQSDAQAARIAFPLVRRRQKKRDIGMLPPLASRPWPLAARVPCAIRRFTSEVRGADHPTKRRPAPVRCNAGSARSTRHSGQIGGANGSRFDSDRAFLLHRPIPLDPTQAPHFGQPRSTNHSPPRRPTSPLATANISIVHKVASRHCSRSACSRPSQAPHQSPRSCWSCSCGGQPLCRQARPLPSGPILTECPGHNVYSHSKHRSFSYTPYQNRNRASHAGPESALFSVR